MSFKCLTCGCKMRVRTSSPVTETTRAVYYECTNKECREEHRGYHQLGDVCRPSKLAFKEQYALDAFMLAVPKDKRQKVLNILNS